MDIELSTRGEINEYLENVILNPYSNLQLSRTEFDTQGAQTDRRTEGPPRAFIGPEEVGNWGKWGRGSSVQRDAPFVHAWLTKKEGRKEGRKEAPFTREGRSLAPHARSLAPRA